MSAIRRRTFLLTMLAAAPIATCAPGSRPWQSPGPRRRQGFLVQAGHDRQGRPRTVLGGLRIDEKVSTGDTAGDLYVIEHTDHAKTGPPRHVHPEQGERFYVLEGTYRAEVGEERHELRAGEAVFAPRGVPHVWAHTGAGTGRLLIAFQPARQMESFFAAMAQRGTAPSPEALRPLFSAHSMRVVGPPLSV